MILVNGQTDIQLSPTDRGFQYGDGLFETLYVNQAGIEFWREHLQRLSEGCQRLGLKPPNESLLFNESRRLIDNSTTPAVLKILISRSGAGRGYRPPVDHQVTRIVSLHPLALYPDHWQTEGVQVRICSTLASINPSLAGIKHINRLEQVLARTEWGDERIAEGLMFDALGRLIEGTMTNVFLVKGGELYTPNIAHAGVLGVMRRVLIDAAARLDIAVHVGDIDQEQLAQADEVLLTNSIIGVWLVKSVDEFSYSLGQIGQQLQLEVGRIRQKQTLALS